jgi:hypothetical protein
LAFNQSISENVRVGNTFLGLSGGSPGKDYICNPLAPVELFVSRFSSARVLGCFRRRISNFVLSESLGLFAGSIRAMAISSLTTGSLNRRIQSWFRMQALLHLAAFRTAWRGYSNWDSTSSSGTSGFSLGAWRNGTGPGVPQDSKMATLIIHACQLFQMWQRTPA